MSGKKMYDTVQGKRENGCQLCVVPTCAAVLLLFPDIYKDKKRYRPTTIKSHKKALIKPKRDKSADIHRDKKMEKKRLFLRCSVAGIKKSIINRITSNEGKNGRQKCIPWQQKGTKDDVFT